MQYKRNNTKPAQRVVQRAQENHTRLADISDHMNDTAVCMYSLPTACAIVEDSYTLVYARDLT